MINYVSRFIRFLKRNAIHTVHMTKDVNELNIFRCIIFSVIYIFFYIFGYCISPQIKSFQSSMLGMISSSVYGLVTFLIVLCACKVLKDEKITSFLVQFYWIFSYFVLLPFFQVTAYLNEVPKFMFVYILFIGVYPIFNGLKFLPVYFITFVICLFNLFFLPIPENRISFYILIIFACFMVSCFNQVFFNKFLRKVYKDSVIDYLTGVLNRKGGYEQYDELVKYCVKNNELCVVFMIDIDYFKSYNDTLGHPEGDKILRKVSHALRECFPSKNDVVSRIGGEEFMACARVKSREGAFILARRMQQSVLNLKIPAIKQEASPFLSISVGMVVETPTDEGAALDYLNLADKFLYKAKVTGRNRVIHNDEEGRFNI